MTTDPLLARLAAANPVPAANPARLVSVRPARRPRARLAVALVAAAIAVPAVAFADNIGALLGIFSNQGTTVAASDTPLSGYPKLNEAMQELGLTTMQLLGDRDGISFYAARNPDGHFCFAIASPRATGVGCRLDNEFPSGQDPVIDMFSSPEQVAGFAADSIAEVALLDASGATLTTVPVVDNIYALTDPPAGGAGIEALDANGGVVFKRMFDQVP